MARTLVLGLLLAITLSHLASIVTAVPQLVMLYSIQRNGARNLLPKDSKLREQDAIGGPTLLPEGERECYNAGMDFHDRYINNVSCKSTTPVPTCLTTNGKQQYGVEGDANVGYDNFDVLVRSSSLDRAVLSAISFFTGVFPPREDRPEDDLGHLPTNVQLVPVYSLPDEDDILIRAYTKCPAYQANLTNWYLSKEFKDKEKEVQPFIDEVNNELRKQGTNGDVTLEGFWNFFDRFIVYEKYARNENEFPWISNDIEDGIYEVAYWLETAKMSPKLTGNMLGGPLLTDIIDKINKAADYFTRNPAPNYYKLISMSGHYNTMLGLLAALISNTPNPDTSHIWFREVPETASVMVFELFRLDGGSFGVRLVAQNGPEQAYETISLPCTKPNDEGRKQLGDGACSLSAFQDLVRKTQLVSVPDWCAYCATKDTPSCEREFLKGTFKPGVLNFARGGGEEPRWRIPVAVVVTFVGVALLCGAAYYYWRMKQPRKPEWSQHRPTVTIRTSSSNYLEFGSSKHVF